LSRTGSKNKGSIQIKDGLRANMLDFTSPVGSQVVEAEAIGDRIDQIAQALTYYHPTSIVHFKFENGKLDALTEVPTNFGNAPQAPFTADGNSAHVIADQDHHGISSLP
jgi:hypothetical protein